MEQLDSVQMFWKLPELVEKLVSFLDPRSTLHLLQSHVMDKKSLQDSFSTKAWTQLIKGSQRDEDGLIEKQDVKDLVKILKLLQLEEPSTFLLHLLDLICESSPDQGHIVMSCPSHTEPHIISAEAFLLLEEVEGVFGSAEQSIKSMSKVNLGWLDIRLSRAIASRMSRQREAVTSIIDVGFMVRRCSSDLQAFTALMQAQEVSFEYLYLGSIGGEGWQELAAAFHSNPNVVIWTTRISKWELSEGTSDAIMKIWDATTTWFLVCKPGAETSLSVNKSKYDPDDAWARLQLISKMTDEEFIAESKKEDEEDTEEDTESDGEDDGEDAENEGEDDVEGGGEQ